MDSNYSSNLSDYMTDYPYEFCVPKFLCRLSYTLVTQDLKINFILAQQYLIMWAITSYNTNNTIMNTIKELKIDFFVISFNID